MTRLRMALVAMLIIAFNMFLWIVLPLSIALGIFTADSSGCDEFIDHGSSNTRGDVVEEYMRACTGFGTVVDNSIILQLSTTGKAITIALYDDAQEKYPQFQWIDDDTLAVDLGTIRWVTVRHRKVGSIHISYEYTKNDIDWPLW
ncbi:MAG TPA: hypothetical protein VME69_00270 [Methylocella sp.]|nr:hypothetical protein [Methylocella sp.]